MFVSQSETGSLESLPVPLPDLFGFCDNYKSPTFLQTNAQVECMQRISNLGEASSTFLNPLSYNIFFLNGTGAESDRSQIRTGKVYTRASDGSVTESTSAVTAPVYSAGTCSSFGVVQEVSYQVYYTESAKGVYIINDIVVDLMLLDSVSLDSQFCGSAE